METAYKKIGRRYVPCGIYHHEEFLNNGLWLVQQNGKSLTSMMWLVGELKDPANVVNHAALQTLALELAKYIGEIQEEGSSSNVDLMKNFRTSGSPKVLGISNWDLAHAILRHIAVLIEPKTKPSKTTNELNKPPF